MKEIKKMGIWMDHSKAHLIAYNSQQMITILISSGFSKEDKNNTLEKSEQIMHNKEQDQQWSYYKKISAVIEKYDEVIIFGPTDAKKELFNKLKANQTFNNIKIDIKTTEKMTENQEYAFVKEYFTNTTTHSATLK